MKSISLGFEEPAALRSQVQAPAGRAPHWQRSPDTAFSVAAFSQVQLRADCLPQEHLACLAARGRCLATVYLRTGKAMISGACGVILGEGGDSPQTHSPPAALPQQLDVAFVTSVAIVDGCVELEDRVVVW